ncbi:MAG: NAD(P)H-dependent oxidoreductase subunit E, partial [Casimicrobiaceae bacterium]
MISSNEALGVKARPKGRVVDATALAEVRALLGDAPRERTLLIEHLHRIQDRYGCLSPAHVVALAQEMRLATTEVYEVATFYHHFDVLQDGEAPPPPVTIRVCETLSCRMACAEALKNALAAHAGTAFRVVDAPCVG